MNKFLILSICIILTGCGASTQEVGDNEFDPNKIAYFKDKRTNVCYAVISYSRVASNGHLAYGLSHSVVQCNNEVEKLLRK